jgi:antitoxin component HigA of HigAB toxin-antitoxin module
VSQIERASEYQATDSNSNTTSLSKGAKTIKRRKRRQTASDGTNTNGTKQHQNGANTIKLTGKQSMMPALSTAPTTSKITVQNSTTWRKGAPDGVKSAQTAPNSIKTVKNSTTWRKGAPDSIKSAQTAQNNIKTVKNSTTWRKGAPEDVKSAQTAPNNIKTVQNSTTWRKNAPDGVKLAQTAPNNINTVQTQIAQNGDKTASKRHKHHQIERKTGHNANTLSSTINLIDRNQQRSTKINKNRLRSTKIN